MITDNLINLLNSDFSTTEINRFPDIIKNVYGLGKVRIVTQEILQVSR